MENSSISIKNGSPDAPKYQRSYGLVLKGFAHVISVLFHPLFIPVMATWYLAFIQPGYFTGIPPGEKMMIVLRVGYNTIFYPALTVILLKAVGFIKSIFTKVCR